LGNGYLHSSQGFIMKNILLILSLLFICTQAEAQNSRNPCYLNGQQSTNGIPSCEPVSNTKPLPVILGGAAPSAQGQPVVVNPANASSANVSFTTSATPGTATTPIAANANRRVIKFRVEGAGVVCFSKYTTTPVCGAAGTFSLAAPSSAANGTGGSYVTPSGFTDQEAWSVVSSTASVVVFADWQ
jgi:hypothetical protein